MEVRGQIIKAGDYVSLQVEFNFDAHIENAVHLRSVCPHLVQLKLQLADPTSSKRIDVIYPLRSLSSCYKHHLDLTLLVQKKPERAL